MWPNPKIDANIGVKKVSELSLVKLPAKRERESHYKSIKDLKHKAAIYYQEKAAK